MMKTSVSDPILIAGVTIPGIAGIVGVTFCPGKVMDGSTAEWRRDLDMDLKAIRDWGAEILVSLIEPREFAHAGVPDMSRRMPPGLEHLRMPIRDFSVPGPEWMALWKEHGPRLRALLARGGRVCVHCMGGLGRSGLVAAILLVEFGVDPEEAMKRVRAVRPGAIENLDQEAFLRAWRPLA